MSKFKELYDVEPDDIAVDICENQWRVVDKYTDIKKVIDDFGTIQNVKETIHSPNFGTYTGFIVGQLIDDPREFVCFPYSDEVAEDCVGVPFD